jgi:hypothetical protein
MKSDDETGVNDMITAREMINHGTEPRPRRLLVVVVITNQPQNQQPGRRFCHYAKPTRYIDYMTNPRQTQGRMRGRGRGRGRVREEEGTGERSAVSLL